MSWNDFSTSGPAPPGPGLQSSIGFAMRYRITTSLNVGSCSSCVLSRWRNTANGVGSNRRSVRRSIVIVSCRSSSMVPSSRTAAERRDKPSLMSAITGLGLPMNASSGSMSSISSSMSIFCAMNMPFAFAKPFPRLKSKAESANCVKPWLSAGFCLSSVPSSSLSNLSHAISIGRLNMKSSAFASSHSVCVRSEKFASAISEQKSVTKSTDRSANSFGESWVSVSAMSASFCSCAAVTRSKFRFSLSRESRYSKWNNSRTMRMKSFRPSFSVSGMSSRASSCTWRARGYG